jgi:hypothetical protein
MVRTTGVTCISCPDCPTDTEDTFVANTMLKFGECKIEDISNSSRRGKSRRHESLSNT